MMFFRGVKRETGPSPTQTQVGRRPAVRRKPHKSGRRRRCAARRAWLFKGLRLTAGRRPTWVCGAYVTPMLALGAHVVYVGHILGPC